MLTRMKVNMSGSRDGVDWPARGETVDLPDAEAAHMVASGLAEPVDDQPAEETATAPATEEKAVLARRKPAAKKP